MNAIQPAKIYYKSYNSHNVASSPISLLQFVIENNLQHFATYIAIGKLWTMSVSVAPAKRSFLKFNLYSNKYLNIRFSN